MKNHDPKVLWQATFTFGQGSSLNLIPKHAHLNMAHKFTATTSCIYSTQTKIDKQSGPLYFSSRAFITFFLHLFWGLYYMINLDEQLHVYHMMDIKLMMDLDGQLLCLT